MKKKDKGKFISDVCVIECGSDSSDFDLVGYQNIVGFDEWIFYMGYTYHMCPHKEWFFKLEEVDGGVVLYG